MGLLNETARQYYDNSNGFGGYQFISLHDIISQFKVAYVGEDKIISKISRTDVAFHAQRALQELFQNKPSWNFNFKFKRHCFRW